MAIKLGDKNISAIYLGDKPIIKAYLGTNLVYQKITETYFNTCPFPSSWTKTDTKSYYATNDYGKWLLYSDYAYNSSYACDNVFDLSGSTYWRTNSSNQNYCGITLPTGIAIKPTKIYCHYKNVSSTNGYIQGFNVETNAWENITSLITSSSSSSSNAETFDISTENYYTDFRVYAKRYYSATSYAYVYELQITEGYIKEV